MTTVKAISRFAIAPLCLVASPAFAEVCDKVRPTWSGERVGVFGEFANFLLSYLGAFVVAVVVSALLTRWIWLLAFAVLLNLTVASAVAADWFFPIEIGTAAHSEGCIGSPILILASTTIAFFGLWIVAIRTRRLNGNR